eukprot:9194938-Pyramimonas_sp.AAC.1
MAAWLVAEGCDCKAAHQDAFFVAGISRAQRCVARERLKALRNGELLASKERPLRPDEGEEPA